MHAATRGQHAKEIDIITGLVATSSGNPTDHQHEDSRYGSEPEWSEFASIQHFFNRACHHRPDLNLTDAARHPFEKDGFQHLHLPQYVQAIRDKYRNDRTMAKYHMLDQVKYISKITIGHDFVTYDPSSFVPVARQRVLTLLIIRNALHDTQ